MPRSAFWLTVVLVLAGLLGLRETRRADGALAGVDAKFLDWLMANAGNAARRDAAGAGRVTLVEIDDATLRERTAATGGGGGNPAGAAVPDPPLSALDYALFLQGAESLGAAVAAVEPVLAWPRERQQGEYERILLTQALRTPKLLLAVRGAGERRRSSPATAVANPEPAVENRPLSPLAASGGGLPTANPAAVVPPLRRVRGDVSGLPELTDLARRPAERLLLAGTPGPADLPAGILRPDGDGVVRAVPLLFRGPEGEVLPAFALQAAMLLFRLTPDEITVDLDARAVNLGPATRVPVDAAGAMRVDFTAFRRLPRFALDDFLLAASGNQRAAASPAASPAVPPPAAGGVMLLGRGDAAARSLPLPTGETGTPAELLAAALGTLGRRWFVIRAPWVYDLVIIVGVAILGRAFLPLRRGTALALTGAFLLVYTLMTLAVFEIGRLWLPWALPAGLLLVLAGLLAGLTAHRPEGPHAGAAEVAKDFQG